jgi:DNA polymerase III delta subunit
MKLILIHGSFQEPAFSKLAQIKKDFNPLSITESSGSVFNISSPGLFSEKRLIIVENPDLKVVEKVIDQTDSELTIVLKFSKLLEKSSPILKKALEIKAEVLTFTEVNQTSIFPLLDLLGNKSQNSFKEFEKNYSEFGAQYLLTMLAYFLRRMTQKEKSSSDFMRQKIESQKRNFPLNKIEELYREIIETDFKIKQGLLEEKLGLTMLIGKILN